MWEYVTDVFMYTCIVLVMMYGLWRVNHAKGQTESYLRSHGKYAPWKINVNVDFFQRTKLGSKKCVILVFGGG